MRVRWTPGPLRWCVRPPLLAFYTDGLVERRGVDLDSRLEQLCRVAVPAAAETACARIMASLVGNQPATDDIALLVVRHRPPAD